jgi:hypothetical protein
MPNPEAFLHGFKIKKSMIIADYRLDEISIEHVTIKRYKQYEYPIEMTFTYIGENSPNPDLLLADLKDLTSEDIVIYTSYGNPYECSFGNPSIISEGNDQITISSEGHSYRIYE